MEIVLDITKYNTYYLCTQLRLSGQEIFKISYSSQNYPKVVRFQIL